MNYLSPSYFVSLPQVLGLFIVLGQSLPPLLTQVLDEEDWAWTKAETSDPLVGYCCAIFVIFPFVQLSPLKMHGLYIQLLFAAAY